MKKRNIAIVLALMAIAVMAFSACNGNDGGGSGGSGGDTGQPSAQPSGSQPGTGGELVEKGYQSDMQKDEIIIRGVRPSTGPNAIFEQTAFGPQYRMWADEINQDGGVYIKSLDRKVPVNVQVYDDGSDTAKTTQLFEQVCASEKPDLVLAPDGTEVLFACSPIAQKYGYLLLAAEGGAKELEKYLPPQGANSNTFSILSYSETQVPAFVKLIEELGIESVYGVFVDDLHGTEYWGAIQAGLDAIGVTHNDGVPIPLDGNFDPDAVVNAAMQSGADVFLCETYPPGSIPIAMSAVKLGYSPNMYFLGPGGSYDYFGDVVFGDITNKSLDGISGWGAWNEKSSESAKGYSQHFRQYHIDKGEFWLNADGTPNPDGTVYQDWWGHICYYSVMQILQQALENAGELTEDGMINNDTLVEYVSSASFDTVMNPQLHFTNNILTDDMYLGNVGQWQNGVFEVIDNDGRRTADPIYPKPPWPTN